MNTEWKVEKIKQIMPIPENRMAVFEYENVNGEKTFEDWECSTTYLVVATDEDGADCVFLGDLSGSDGYGQIAGYGNTTENYIKLIPRYKCKDCGNYMTVRPFKSFRCVKYVCPVCGWSMSEKNLDAIEECDGDA